MNTKLLTYTVGGKQIEPPGSLSHLTPSKTGFAGQGIFQLAIQLLFVFAIILSLSYMIWGGIQWIMSGGEKNGIEAARQKIIYAVIGLVLVFAAFLILSAISVIFGIELLTPPPDGTTVQPNPIAN